MSRNPYVGVIAVWITTCNSVNALTKQIEHRVKNLGLLPALLNTLCQTLRQIHLGIDRFQKDGSAVGATVRLIEACGHWLGKKIGK